MKLVKGLILIFIAVSLVNCGSDDGGSSFDLSEDNLVGSYAAESIESDSARSLIEADGTLTPINTTSSEADNIILRLTFSSNGTFTIAGAYENTVTTSSSTGSDTETDDVIVSDSGTYTLDVENETITLVSDDFGGVYNIDRFTEDELFVSVTIEEENSVDNTTTITESTFEFERD